MSEPKLTTDQMIARIVSDNDRDQAECDEWMRTATNGQKMAVWSLIQHDFKNPVMETMSRFAQLAFAQSAARVNGPPSRDIAAETHDGR